MNLLNPLFHAIAFLTRLPVPMISQSDRDWKRSAVYYPWVGMLIGLLLCLVGKVVLTIFPAAVAAVLILIMWVYLTGGLHLDGWMDLADGIGSNRSRERMLEIMKDSRVGAMGVIAAFLLLMLKMSAIYEIGSSQSVYWLTLPPFIARFTLVIAIQFWPYLSEQGIGSGLKEGLNARNLSINAVLVLGICIYFYHIWGAVIIVAAVVSGCILLKSITRKLGGLTGDCYGALVEWTETSTLLFILLSGSWL